MQPGDIIFFQGPMQLLVHPMLASSLEMARWYILEIPIKYPISIVPISNSIGCV